MVKSQAATVQAPGIPAERMVTVNEDKASAAQEQEWLRQLSLIYSGLIVIGVYLVAPFLTAASLDLPAKVCVVAFSVAIPLLAALAIVNRQEVFRRRATTSVLATIAWVVAQTSPSLAWSPASGTSPGSLGVGMLAGGLVGVAVHSAGYTRLECDQAPSLAPRPAERRQQPDQ
jgi:hypothetical protein